MCIATIRYCDCLECCRDLSVGSLQRVDFCKAQQKVLGDIWTRWTPYSCSLNPCAKLSFTREMDPESCKYSDKNGKNGAEQTNSASDRDYYHSSSLHPAASESMSTTRNPDRASKQPENVSNGFVSAGAEYHSPSPRPAMSFQAINKPRKKLPDSRPPLFEERLRAAAQAAIDIGKAAKAERMAAARRAAAAASTPAPAAIPAAAPASAAADASADADDASADAVDAADASADASADGSADGSADVSAVITVANQATPASPVAEPAPAAATVASPADENMNEWSREEMVKLLLCRSRNMKFEDICQVSGFAYHYLLGDCFSCESLALPNSLVLFCVEISPRPQPQGLH